MPERRRAKAGRRRGAVALGFVALGALLLTAGAASGATLGGNFAIITFWNNYNVVTLDIPAKCPMTNPNCQYMLWVNEPDVPAQTFVGSAVGTSGVLTVPYPSNFCGTLQADVFVGPTPWRLVYGHQQTIQSGTCCPTTTAAATSQATSPTTSTTTASAHDRSRRARSGHPNAVSDHRTRSGRAGTTTTTTSTTSTTTPTSTQDVTCSPITGETQTVPGTTSQLPFTGTTSATPASSPTNDGSATLPFTGIDLKPLVIAGTTLILAGLTIGTTREQRWRALARAGSSVRSSRGASYSTRVARWFLGE